MIVEFDNVRYKLCGIVYWKGKKVLDLTKASSPIVYVQDEEWYKQMVACLKVLNNYFGVVQSVVNGFMSVELESSDDRKVYAEGLVWDLRKGLKLFRIRRVQKRDVYGFEWWRESDKLFGIEYADELDDNNLRVMYVEGLEINVLPYDLEKYLLLLAMEV